MSDQLQAIATVMSLVNPAICAAMFTQIESGRSKASRTADGIKSMAAVIVILAVAALFGAKVLQMFGISLDAFKVAGGLVLAWMGFQMLKGESPGASAAAKDQSADQISLTPLILFAASPGTMTGVITLAVAHSGTAIPTTALVAIAVTAVVTLAVMMVVSSVGGKQKNGFVHETSTRFMGLIVIAMGIQFALTGIKAFMV